MSNTLEIIMRDIQKIAEQFLQHEGPLDKIMNACGRFIALQGHARIECVMQDLNDALHSINQYAERLRRLIADASKYVD